MEEKYTKEERIAFIKSFLSDDEFAQLSGHALAMQLLIDLAIHRAEIAIYGDSKE